ncbi:MAG: hypothetical protein IPK82_19520 [Polyangiaceae bacterium]|nr:hypothetical protein [Polyangiaceae bacterium]
MAGAIRGAIREGDHVEYDGKQTVVGESLSAVYINGVRAAHTETPLVSGGAIEPHENDVYIGLLPGGGTPLSPPPLFHIHLDADRDGQIDADYRRNDEWTWDHRYPGAMVMVNLDPTQKFGPRNPKLLSPLAVRRDPRTAGNPTAGWKGKLRVSSKYKIRIFNSAGQTLLIGPDTPSDALEFDLTSDETLFTMEGVQYPGLYPGPGRDPDPSTANSTVGFDGLIRLHLELFDPKGKLAHHEVAQVRVAPWVAFNHSDPTETVFVAAWAESQDIRDKVAKYTGAYIRTLPTNGDQWTQDQAELGFSTRASDVGRVEQRAMMLVKNSTFEAVATSRLLPVRTADQIPNGNLDFGGNLECTPPFVHPDNGTVYSFGRLYYGHPLPDPTHPPHHAPAEAAARVFFDQQSVQAPFQLDSGWLRVGHIDEILTCIPMADARLGFRVAYASARLAADILDPLPDSIPIFAHHADEKLQEVQDILDRFPNPQGSRAWDFTNLSMNVGFLKGKTPYNAHVYDFVTMIDFVEKKLEIARDTLKRECGLRDDDFIPVPVVFQGILKAGNSVSSIAFTPGLVNGLTVTKGPTTWGGARQIVFVAPKPFGPPTHANGNKPTVGDCLFEEAMIKAFGNPSQTGVQVVFADAFTGYHMLWGEVHCGTNSLRVPPSDRVWWAPRRDTRGGRP